MNSLSQIKLIFYVNVFVKGDKTASDFRAFLNTGSERVRSMSTDHDELARGGKVSAGKETERKERIEGNHLLNRIQNQGRETYIALQISTS